MTTLMRLAGCALALSVSSQLAASAAEILVDQVGYETHAAKQALVQVAAGETPQGFEVVEVRSGKPVLKGELRDGGTVAHWQTGHYWLADFSALVAPGKYRLTTRVDGKPLQSFAFAVQDNVLERHTLSDVIYYFKGQRDSGPFAKADSHLPLPQQGGFIDAHGGWYDATGDYGIHLSHQNPTSYFNPQQASLVEWVLVASYRQLQARQDPDFTQYLRRLLDEAMFGADFLVRIKRADGSFYQSIAAPGKDKLAADREINNPNQRTRIKLNPGETTTVVVKEDPVEPHAYEASFRSGAGLAIAGLAAASTLPDHGEFDNARYLQVATEAYRFLAAHNVELVNDGKENIVDDYCALLAAVELYKASHDAQWLKEADGRANRLMARLTTHEGQRDYWRADDATRPYFHPSDAGLPVVALVGYADVASATQKARVRDAVKRSLDFELRTTAEVNNPFGYARQLVRGGDGKARTAFFFPHDSEAAPWWQGENARLASLSAAARIAAPMFGDDPGFQHKLQAYAWDQLHWILGRNPYDSSMLMGSGQNNAPYMFFDSYQYTSAPGAIINGITAGLDDEDGIAFDLGYAQTGRDDDWRWTEQWLPHDAWYLYAVSLPHD